MPPFSSNIASHNPGIRETLSSMAGGVRGYAGKLRGQIATKVIATIEGAKTLSHELTTKATDAVRQHAMENILRANETVDESQKNLAYLKQVQIRVRQSLEARSGLIKIEYQKKQEEIKKTESDMAKTRQEITQTKRWSLPGKKAKLLKKFQTLSATLAQYHGQAQELQSRYSGLRTFYRRINTIDAVITQEDALLKKIHGDLNPTPSPTTISGLRALTASFAREHRPLLAISTIEIGSLGLELTEMYHSIEKVPALKTHIF